MLSNGRGIFLIFFDKNCPPGTLKKSLPAAFTPGRDFKIFLTIQFYFRFFRKSGILMDKSLFAVGRKAGPEVLSVLFCPAEEELLL